MPGFIKPQLATLRSKAPSGDQWLHEIKFDGYRIQLQIKGGHWLSNTVMADLKGMGWAPSPPPCHPDPNNKLPERGGADQHDHHHCGDGSREAEGHADRGVQECADIGHIR